jgi:hypothetical protein
VQVEVSLKVWLSAPSVPHEADVGVQASEVAGSVPAPEHWLLSTVVPSERRQVTACVAVPEFAVCTQEPVRVWVRPVPQPVVGVQEVYCQEAVPPEQAP